MKNNIIRAAAFAAAALFTLTSCSSKSVSSGSGDSAPIPGEVVNNENTTKTAQLVYSDSYKAEKLGAADIMGVTELSPFPDGSWFASGGTREMNMGLRAFRFTSDFSSYTDITPDIEKDFEGDAVFAQYFLTSEGNIAALVDSEDHGGMKLPTTPEEEANFNYQSFEDNCRRTYYYALYDQSGKLISKSEGMDLSQYYDSYGNLSFPYAHIHSSGSIYMSSNELNILRITPEGEVSLIYQPDEKERRYNTRQYYDMCGIFNDRDGRLMLMSSGYIDEDNTTTNKVIFRELDPDSGALSDPVYTIESQYQVLQYNTVYPGRGDFRFIYSDGEGLVGVKDDGSAVTILRWQDSDIGAVSLRPCGEEDYVGYYNPFTGNEGAGLYKFTRRLEGEGEETVLLTYADIGGEWFDSSEMISKFNRSQKAYRIQKVDYSKYDGDGPYLAGALEQLKRDIITGDAPDIINVGDPTLIQSLSGKGAFAELGSYLDSDPEVNRESILPNILEALSDSNGNIYSLPFQFGVQTLAVKTKFGQRENWTMEEMIGLFDDAPASADHIYDELDRNEMFTMMLSGMSGLVDYSKAECHFDSEQFIKLLEFCKRFTSDKNIPSKFDDPYSHQQYYADKFSWWSSDRVLAEPVRMGYDGDIRFTRYVEAQDEITLTGYPSDNGKGGKLYIGNQFAVMNTCSDKAGAWSFISTMLSEDFQRENAIYYSVNKDVFGEQMDELLHIQDFNEAGDGLVDVEYRETKGAKEYPLTQAERDDLERYILSCRDMVDAIDKDIKSICLEEAGIFFAGEHTASEAAEMIQDRCSILLSEQA